MWYRLIWMWLLVGVWLYRVDNTTDLIVVCFVFCSETIFDYDLDCQGSNGADVLNELISKWVFVVLMSLYAFVFFNMWKWLGTLISSSAVESGQARFAKFQMWTWKLTKACRLHEAYCRSAASFVRNVRTKLSHNIDCDVSMLWCNVIDVILWKYITLWCCILSQTMSYDNDKIWGIVHIDMSIESSDKIIRKANSAIHCCYYPQWINANDQQHIYSAGLQNGRVPQWIQIA